MNIKDQQGGVEIVSMESLLAEKIGNDDGGESNDNTSSTNLKDLLADDPDDMFANKDKDPAAEEEKEKSSLNIEDNKGAEADKEEEDEKESSEKRVVNQSPESETFRQILKNTFGDKIKSIEQEIDGEVVEVSIDDMELDSETFTEILKSYTELEKEEAAKGKVSLDRVSDFTKQVIEIEDKGGKVADLFQMKQDLVDPLENLDLTDPKDQRTAIYLRLNAKGRDDEEIANNIRAWEDKGILEEKAIEADAELRKAIQTQLELRKQQAADEVIKRQELEKNYKKDLKSELGTQFELADNIKNKIVDLSTKKDENFGFGINRAYSEKMKDPKQAAELALFLLDRDEYIKQVTNKKLTDHKLETARKIRIVRDTEGTKGASGVKKEKEGSISLSALENEKV